MKNVLLAFSIILGSQAAYSKTIASYNFVADVKGQARDITTTLEESGELKITSTQILGGAKLDATFKLEQEQLNGLTRVLRQLATAKVVTTHQDVVCMVKRLPGAPASKNLLVASKFDGTHFGGKLRLVKSQDGCWLRDHTAPVEPTQLNNAVSVQTGLAKISVWVLSAK